MKACADCGPCLMKRILFQTRLSGTDCEFESIKQCMALYSELMNPQVCSADISTKVHSLSYKLMDCEDPYHQMKVDADAIAEKFLHRSEEFIESSKNRFQAAVRISIVGNIMDFGSGNAIDDPEEFVTIFDDLLGQDIGLDETEELEQLIDKSDTILYAFDNCGESQLDKLLIRDIRSKGKTVIGIVRGKPILNDVTYEDALRIGLDKELDRIITTGGFHVGFPLVPKDSELLKALNSADLLIAKGMANYESLSEWSSQIPIAFLLKAKCPPVARSLDVPVGTNVVALKK